MPRFVPALATVLLAVVALEAAPQPSPAAPAQKDAVNLGFCWQPGMKADVTASVSRTRTNAPPQTGTIRYTLDVSGQDEHLLIRLLDPVADLSAARRPVSTEVQAQIDERLDDLMPDYLVTREGKFAGVSDLHAYQSKVRALIEKSLSPKVDRAAVQKAIDRMTSEPVLNARASQEWNVLVAAWAGNSLPVGVEQSRQIKIGNPKAPILVTHTFAATARVPCRRGGRDRNCVQLDLRSVPDEAAIKSQVGTALAAMGRSATSEVRALEIEEHVRLITESDCLIPHSLTRTRRQKATVVDKGKEQVVERTDRNVLTYTFR